FFSEPYIVFMHDGAAFVNALTVDKCADLCAQVVQAINAALFQQHLGMMTAHLVNLESFKAKVAVARPAYRYPGSFKCLCLAFAGSGVKYEMACSFFQVAPGSW